MSIKESVTDRAQKIRDALPMDFMTIRQYMGTLKDAGCNLSEHYIRGLVNDGTIPSVKSGNTHYISKTVADKVIHDQANKRKRG